MRSPGGNRDRIGDAGRHVDLPSIVESPSDYRAVTTEGKTEISPGGDRHYICSSSGNIGLAQVTIAPGDDRAVAPKQQAVVVARRNCFYVGDALVRRSVGLAGTVV